MRLHQTAAPLAKVWAPKAVVLLSGHNERAFAGRLDGVGAVIRELRPGVQAADPPHRGPARAKGR